MDQMTVPNWSLCYLMLTCLLVKRLHCANTNKCSAIAENGDRLATIDMDRKFGAVPFRGGPGFPCNTM